jgi:maleate isomerase
MLIDAGTSPERIIAMDREDGRRAISQIASCRPHAIAYGCTASSIIQGHAFDARLREEIRENTGAAATTATDSIFAACHALELKRVTAISPYPEEVDAAEHRFFAEAGIETITHASLGIHDGFRLAEPDRGAILDLAMRAWDPQSDGLIAACLNFRSHLVIDALETRIGKAGRDLDPGGLVAAAAPCWRCRPDHRLRPPVACVLTSGDFLAVDRG